MSTNETGTDARIHPGTVEASRVRLVPLSPPMSGWWAAGPGVFEAQTGLLAGEAGAWIGSVLSMTRAPDFEGPGGGWHGFWAVRGEEIVGTCAYAARADSQDRWEVAYFTFPPFESQGCGKAMASCLVEKWSEVHPGGVAMAKTLPVESASTRILTRLGFRRTADASDSEHGIVWVWERPARDL
jgi:RimJ/RimL family protein N-acetyltransferase